VRIIVAPDKFKGSLTALEVCTIIKTSLSQENPQLEIETIPLADGGEGTCEILTNLSNGRAVSLTVLDPLMRKINSSYGISGDGKVAFIEMALASGLQLLQSHERNCTVTSTFGTGQLIKHAIEQGVREIVMGIGGSATNDAGMGMAQALGYRFISASGETLEGIGKNLIHIAEIDASMINANLRNTQFTVLSDVENPLYGREGAAFVFARQKGATEHDIALLDQGLKNFAHLAERMDCDVMFSGAGAAGGLGAGTKLFLNAQIKSGIDFITDFTQLEEKIKNSDMVITGEGKVDTQTLSGKVVKGVATLAHQYQKKLILVCGTCELSQKQLQQLGIAQLISLLDADTPITDAMRNAKTILKQKAKQIHI
jgi:glycerate kinase